MKLFEKQKNMKQHILHLRKELLEYKKKNNDFQHRINRRHMTQQILTNFDDKSIVKGINKFFFIANDAVCTEKKQTLATSIINISEMTILILM